MLKNLIGMCDAVADAYEGMIHNLKAAHMGALTEVTNAYNAEDRINNMRNHLRDSEIEAIESGSKNYPSSVYYMDVVNELEKMGDFIINISQDLEKAFRHN
jgi:phosphate:Na+ symporter